MLQHVYIVPWRSHRVFRSLQITVLCCTASIILGTDGTGLDIEYTGISAHGESGSNPTRYEIFHSINILFILHFTHRQYQPSLLGTRSEECPLLNNHNHPPSNRHLKKDPILGPFTIRCSYRRLFSPNQAWSHQLLHRRPCFRDTAMPSRQALPPTENSTCLVGWSQFPLRMTSISFRRRI
jgi:hypothetical protein